MNLVKAVPFVHNGTSYEIRVFADGYTWTVKTYEGNKEANGYSHSVTLPVAFDLKKQHGLSAVDLLIEDAKSDISEQRWERLLKALGL